MIRIEGEALTCLLRNLHAGLRLAGALFDKSASDHGRHSVIISLTAVTEFLQAVIGREDARLYVPLFQLQYALQDLDRGSVSAMLKPVTIKHRPKTSVAEEGFRAYAAIAMDLLMNGNVPRKEAAQRVARELTRLGYGHGAAKPITAQQVEDWRDRILEERPAEHAPTGRFHRMKQQLLLRFPQDPVAASEFLLHGLPNLVPTQNPKKATS